MNNEEIIQNALYPFGARRSANFIAENGHIYNMNRAELTRGTFEYVIRFLHLEWGDKYKMYSDFIRDDFIRSLTDGGGNRYTHKMCLFLSNPPPKDDPDARILETLFSTVSSVYCEYHTNDEDRIDALLGGINRVFYFIFVDLCLEDRSKVKIHQHLAYQEEFLLSLLGPLKVGEKTRSR